MDLNRAQFHGFANLSGGQFHGDADLTRVQFHGGAGLHGAKFHRGADLRAAHFYKSGDLDRAQLDHGVRMDGARVKQREELPDGWTTAPELHDGLYDVVRIEEPEQESGLGEHPKETGEASEPRMLGHLPASREGRGSV